MADTARNGCKSMGAAVIRKWQNPGRLQRCRPAALQIDPASAASSFWNAEIPLLSSLDSSPAAAEMKLFREEIPRPPQQHVQRNREGEKPLVFKKWQHPAAPFCCEATPAASSFFVDGVRHTTH